MNIERVSHLKTHPLRQRILRPHQTVEEMLYEGDEEGIHYAAIEHDQVVGVASFLRDGENLRLRGMAVDDGQRGKGVGSQIMNTALEDLRDVPMIWCNARIRAVSFYERLGFQTVGEAFDLPRIGPHYRMERPRR